MSHTYATLVISGKAYDEIRKLLADAKYDHCFVDTNVMDMTGIGLVKKPERNSPDAFKTLPIGSILEIVRNGRLQYIRIVSDKKWGRLQGSMGLPPAGSKVYPGYWKGVQFILKRRKQKQQYYIYVTYSDCL